MPEFKISMTKGLAKGSTKTEIDSLDKLFEHGKKAARFLFEAQGSLHPMWIGISKIGEIVPICVDMPKFEDRNSLSGMLKKLFTKHSIEMYVSMLESWMVEPSDKDDQISKDLLSGKLRVAACENRKEIILIEASDGQRTRVGMFNIQRKSDKDVHLSEFEELDGGSFTGRFCNLLKGE